MSVKFEIDGGGKTYRIDLEDIEWYTKHSDEHIDFGTYKRHGEQATFSVKGARAKSLRNLLMEESR